MEQVLVNLTLLLLTFTNSIIFICIVKVFSRVNIFQYKLKNYYLSMFLVFIYISVFFIALYCLRIYMLRDITDLRFIPKYLTLVKNSILLYPLDSIIFLSFIVTLLLIILGILASIHKFFIKHMLRIHVYHFGKSRKLYQWDGILAAIQQKTISMDYKD